MNLLPEAKDHLGLAGQRKSEGHSDMEKVLEALSEYMKRRLEEQRDVAKALLAIRQRMLDEL